MTPAAQAAPQSVRGAPRLFEHVAVLDRVTSPDGPTVRARLEGELGLELAQFLVSALAAAGRVPADLRAG